MKFRVVLIQYFELFLKVMSHAIRKLLSPKLEISPFFSYSHHVAVTMPATNDRAADVFAASQGETHDGESGRRMGHSGAFSGEARSLSGEGPQPRGHAATRSWHQARQLLAHSRQVSQPAVGGEPLTSVASLRST